MEVADSSFDAMDAAAALAAALDECQQDYAIGGGLALGFWADPRGTLDVDLTLFMPPQKPAACLLLLKELGCEFDVDAQDQLLREHGLCHVDFRGITIDVFLPTTPFYTAAKARRRRFALGDQPLMVWDAETLCVFKLMFFRRKDIVDIEQILHTQGAALDRNWVRAHVVEMYGARDARVRQWDELTAEIGG